MQRKRGLPTRIGYEHGVLQAAPSDSTIAPTRPWWEFALYVRGLVEWRKLLGNPGLSITKSPVAWGTLSSSWMKALNKGLFLASWKLLMASGGNCSSKRRFFTEANVIVNIPSMKTTCLNRKMRSSNLQQNKTKIVRLIDCPTIGGGGGGDEQNSCWPPKKGNSYCHSSNTHRKPKT